MLQQGLSSRNNQWYWMRIVLLFPRNCVYILRLLPDYTCNVCSILPQFNQLKGVGSSVVRGLNYQSRGAGFQSTYYNFIHPILSVPFGWDIKSHWSIWPGVYVMGSKGFHTQKWNKSVWGSPSQWSRSIKHTYRCYISSCQSNLLW